MYDADTTELISKAPELDGLNASDLPKLLTRAYAQIVADRIRMREGSSVGEPGELSEIIGRMRRLALTHEALVSINGERENRRSAAFVAASAHHVVAMSEPDDANFSHLGPSSISSEVAATILFLVAEASADAAEMAKRIRVPGGKTVESVLLSCIKHLANGRLREIVNTSLPQEEGFRGSELNSLAVDVLYGHVFHGIVALGSALLGVETSDPESYFRYVKSLAVEDLGAVLGDEAGHVINIFAGPFHLASLLSSAGKDLRTTALVTVRPPGGGSPVIWGILLRHIAQTRPFLWSNHRAAVEAGYLDPGVSSVISFPTGAGKSTLSELKIAAAIARGIKTVFLVPTLALVDQTVRSLGHSFAEENIVAERTDGIDLQDVDLDQLPTISVMTPERCLALLSFDPTIFSKIGLLIFDECHLLHPRSVDQSRRAVDAMFCLLNFVATSPNADILLLSAMMQNAEEIACWIEELTERKCLPLTLNWKPTRQVRGCVVYDAVEVAALRARVRKAKESASTIGPPQALKKSLLASPYGLFSLHQTWASKARADYSLLPLLDEQVLLSLSPSNWGLTSNANQMSMAVANSAAGKKIKTLIFVQTIPLAVSATKGAAVNKQGICVLTGDERRLYEITLDEMGDASCLYLDLGENYQLRVGAVCHHGDLLPPERNLHESLFRRKDGSNIMVATSTLAQGMNLPSELVIISGDSRFDKERDAMERLQAHELLNAAGRAGRAGNNSHGMVLIVPSKVIDFNSANSGIGSAWISLQAIFSQSDQCLKIEDPFEALLDQIFTDPDHGSEMKDYFVSRLPVDGSTSGEGQRLGATALLGRSFAAFKARQRSDQSWIETRVSAAMKFKGRNPSPTDGLTWMDRIAAAIGFPVEMVLPWANYFQGGIILNATVMDWVGYVWDWLASCPELLSGVLRRTTLESLLGKPYVELVNGKERGEYAIKMLKPMLDLWMKGAPLIEIHETISFSKHHKKGEKGREFALQMVPLLAYVFSMPATVFRGLHKELGSEKEPPLGLSCLGSCVREGFDSVEKLAFRHYTKVRALNRRAIHREYEPLASKVGPCEEGDEIAQVLKRIDQATILDGF